MSIDIEQLIQNDLKDRINKSSREQALRKYYNNPNYCKYCGEIIVIKPNETVSDAKKKIFCNEKCCYEYRSTNIKKTKRKCSMCNDEISDHNQSGLCPSCLKKKADQEKIQKWKETGDTGCGVSSTLRNCIRDYILKKQNCKCAICGIGAEWNGKDLHFILDHIDGDASNNFEYNLRLICPNCDSQLDTYKSRNKNSARAFRRTTNLADELVEVPEPT